MKVIRAVVRFLFNAYWGLSIQKRYVNWDFKTRGDKYVGYFLFSKERKGSKITIPMYFDKPYRNKDYALVAMMIHWRLYIKGYKLTKKNKIENNRRKK